jgi:hypothetical protein
MSWNYRVVRRQDESGIWYGIHEVYYSDDGRPTACTEDAVKPGGDTLEELRNDIRYFKEALEKPVLDYDDFVVQEKGL